MSCTDTPWMADGACRGLPPGTMHPDDRRGERRAKAVCATCPVRTACLQHALDADEQYGVWGGCTEGERRAIARRSKSTSATPIKHGTNAGYIQHWRRGVPLCDACRDARSAYEDARRKARQEVAA